VHQLDVTLAREQSFYALIEQFGFAHRRHLHYALRHGRDFVLAIPKLKPD
jgi:hypothetical protein